MSSPQPHPRYELVDKIASGSFATVYRGRDRELGRDVAIKQIHPQYLSDSRQLERYWGEAQLLASLQHPNIVTIYDLVRDRGWLIMELMQSDLSRVAGRRQMDLDALRTALAHALRALKFLHSHGIVHGDVKPSNLMIDRRRRVKLGDFGLARRVANETGSLVQGTAKYMAPEVVAPEFGDVGPASDLYSLGFTAYELLAGENFEALFPGLSGQGRDRQMAWMMWHAAPDRRLPEIGRVLQGVPDDLAKTIQKLCAKPQNQRYRSADEALSDLNIDVKLVKSGDDSSATVQRPAPEAGAERRRRLIAIGAFATSALLSLAMLFWPSGKSSGPTGTEADRSGIVKSIQREEQALDLLTPEGTVVTVPLGKEPIIRLRDGAQDFISLGEVAPDDRVAITFRDVKGEPRATVAVSRPVVSEGVLQTVDATRRQVRVALRADPRPEVVDMSLAGTVQVLLNGKPSEFDKLLPDDRVEVTHLPAEREAVARTIIRLAARRTLRQVGFVAEIVQTPDEPAYLRLDRFGLIDNLPFADNAQVELDGAAAQVGDLKPDDRVLVEYDVEVTGLQATRRPRGSGALMVSKVAERELLVRGNDASEVRYGVPEGCPLLLDGESVGLEKLQKFDKLDITFREGAGGRREAQTIDAKRPR
ncbi:MAG: serine/threonine-protein kinase [Planctomycetaceae bacterium]